MSDGEHLILFVESIALMSLWDIESLHLHQITINSCGTKQSSLLSLYMWSTLCLYSGFLFVFSRIFCLFLESRTAML